MRVIVVGPGKEFLSGISYFTWKLCTTLNATPLLFRDMLPKCLFPGKGRVGKVENKIKYEPYGLFLDWWNPITWIKGVQECNKHDVVILEWWSASVAHMYAFILAFCRQRIIIEVHETVDPLESNICVIRWYARAMRRICWGHADMIVVHTKQDLHTVTEKYDNVYLIPHGVYDQYEKQDIVGSKYFNVLFLGLVRNYKGVKYLIDGFKKSNLPNSNLLICGEHWDTITVQDDENISIYDIYFSDDDIEYVFSFADVVVLPYLRASSSGVAHIAMHYGLPIIATRVGGLADLKDYEGMMYVPPMDSDAIAKKLQYVYFHCRGKTFPVPKRLQWDEIKKEWESLIS